MKWEHTFANDIFDMKKSRLTREKTCAKESIGEGDIENITPNHQPVLAI